MTPLALAFGLVASHAVCDFALQSEAMAKGKNRHNRMAFAPPPGAKFQVSWPYWLSAHAMIHGAGVALVTGIWWLGLAEAVCHACIDFCKCDNVYGINTDQALHYGCKCLWLWAALSIAGAA